MNKKSKVTISPLDLWKELGGVSRCAICIALLVIINSAIVYATRGIVLNDVNGKVISPTGQIVLRFCFVILAEVGVALIAILVLTLIADFKASYESAVCKKARRIITAAIMDMLAIEDNCNRLSIPFQEYTVEHIYEEHTRLRGSDDKYYKIKFEDFKSLLDFDKIKTAWETIA